MMKNNPKFFIAMYTGFLTFLILVLVLFTYEMALGQDKWLLELFQIKFLFNLPSFSSSPELKESIATRPPLARASGSFSKNVSNTSNS